MKNRLQEIKENEQPKKEKVTNQIGNETDSELM